MFDLKPARFGTVEPLVFYVTKALRFVAKLHKCQNASGLPSFASTGCLFAALLQQWDLLLIVI